MTPSAKPALRYRVAIVLALVSCLYVPMIEHGQYGNSFTFYRWLWQGGLGAIDVTRWIIELVAIGLLTAIASWLPLSPLLEEVRQRLKTSDASLAIRIAFLLIVAVLLALVWLVPG